MVRCLIPRDVAREDVVEALRGALGDAVVLVERRVRSRRSAGDRRGCGSVGDADRRAIRNVDGRRVADRRAIGRPAAMPVLPPELDALAPRLCFVEVEPLSAAALEDAAAARVVVRFQSGDRDAFGELYMSCFDAIYGYLRMTLRDPHEAEDATQDVFMQALRALPRYELRGQPPRRWLFRIARNQAIDRARRRRSVPEDPAVLEARLEGVGGPGSTGMFSDAQLSDAVARLPQTQREVLFLRYAEGLDAPEIAALVGRTPAAVRQIHHRTLVELRRRLPAAVELAVA